jgi:hypothetical protein
MEIEKTQATRVANTVAKWRQRSHDLETLVCRLFYYVEHGSYHDEKTLDELRLDVKQIMGVRPLWKKKFNRWG